MLLLAKVKISVGLCASPLSSLCLNFSLYFGLRFLRDKPIVISNRAITLLRAFSALKHGISSHQGVALCCVITEFHSCWRFLNNLPYRFFTLSPPSPYALRASEDRSGFAEGLSAIHGINICAYLCSSVAEVLCLIFYFETFWFKHWFRFAA